MKGVIRSLAVHHQSLAFRARLYDAKSKRLRRRLALVLDKLYLQVNTTSSKNGEVGGGGSAISLVRWGSIGGREEWGKNKRAECKAP